MGVPIAIGSSPQLISRSVSKPYLLYNSGSQTVYIGLDSSVSSLNYAYPLASGNAIQWSEINSDVYGVCANGQKSTVVVTPEASALAIGAVSAKITDPVSLANGTAVGINGPVDASGSQVGVSGTVTAKVSAPVLLAQATVAFPAAVQNYLSILPFQAVDTSIFSSLLITVTQGYTGGAFTMEPRNYIRAGVSFNTTSVTPLNPEWLLDGSMQNSIQVPVVGPLAFVNVDLYKPFASAVGGAIVVNVYGLSTGIDRYKYVSQSISLKGSIPAGGFYVRAQSQLLTTLEYVASINGVATWSALNQGGTGTPGQVQLSVLQGGGSSSQTTMLFQNNAPAGGGNTQILNPLIPPLPLLVTTYSYASSSVQTALMM